MDIQCSFNTAPVVRSVHQNWLNCDFGKWCMYLRVRLYLQRCKLLDEVIYGNVRRSACQHLQKRGVSGYCPFADFSFEQFSKYGSKSTDSIKKKRFEKSQIWLLFLVCKTVFKIRFKNVNALFLIRGTCFKKVSERKTFQNQFWYNNAIVTRKKHLVRKTFNVLVFLAYVLRFRSSLICVPYICLLILQSAKSLAVICLSIFVLVQKCIARSFCHYAQNKIKQ